MLPFSCPFGDRFSAVDLVAIFGPRTLAWPSRRRWAGMCCCSGASRDAQRTIAEEYGFASWDALRTHVESIVGAVSRSTINLPELDPEEGGVWNALTASDDGDLDALRRLVERDPRLSRAEYRYTGCAAPTCEGRVDPSSPWSHLTFASGHEMRGCAVWSASDSPRRSNRNRDRNRLHGRRAARWPRGASAIRPRRISCPDSSAKCSRPADAARKCSLFHGASISPCFACD